MASRERIEREKAELRGRRETEILSAAEALFLEKGFGRTTIGDIAAACELTNGAIYLYFKNKNEIVLIIMTRISRSFGDLLEQADDRSLPGLKRAEALLGVYRKTFREYHNYHVLDGQFNMLFDRKYPETPYLEEYFRANGRILDLMTAVFDGGLADGSLSLSRSGITGSSRETARMFLNVLNSYVEKLSLRRELMEREQGISLEEELDRLITYLVESLRRSV